MDDQKPIQVFVLGADNQSTEFYSFLKARQEEGLIQVVFQDIGDKITGTPYDMAYFDEILNDQTFRIEAAPTKSEKQGHPGDKPWLRRKKGRDNFGRK